MTSRKTNSKILYGLSRLAGPAGVAVIIFSMLINLLMLTGPIFMLQVYDRVLASGSIPTLLALFALVVILYTLFGILDFIRSRIMFQVANKLDVKIRDEAFKAIGHYTIAGQPEVRTQPITDLNKIRQFLSSQGPFAFLDAPWSPIYLAAIYLLHPLLGLASLGAAVLLVILAAMNNYFIAKTTAIAGQKATKAASKIEEFHQNSRGTMALDMTSDVKDRWKSVHDEAINQYNISSNISGMLGSLSKSMRMIFQSGILGLGAYLAVQQLITPGSMIAASILMSRALAPVDQLIANWQNYLGFRQARQRLYKALYDMETKTRTSKSSKSTKSAVPEKPNGKLVVKGLTYGFEGRKEPILKNINFSLEPGDGLGIVGPIGSGKTSLAQIITGVSNKYLGSVSLDGYDFSDYPQNAFGKSMGYLPQRVQLYEGTVAENIARMNPDYDRKEVIEAARDANVFEMIKGLKDGDQHMVQEGGKNLSFGQSHGIGLARALYGKPSLVIMDEPNANLDPNGESLLAETIMNLRKNGITVIVIAHHLKILAVLDKVLVLNKFGQQVDFGDRDSILKKNRGKMPISKKSKHAPKPKTSSTSSVENPFQVSLTGKET